MRRPAHLVRRLTLASALVMGLIIGAIPPVSAAETVQLDFRGQTGPIRILGATGNEVAIETLSLDLAVAGLEPTSTYRVIGSKRACSRTHVPGATVFVQRLPKPGADRAIVRIDISTPKLATLESIRSVRVFTRHTGGTQALCTNEVLPHVATAAAGINLTKESIQLGVVDGAIKGLAVVNYREGGVNDTTFILVGLPPRSSSRIVYADTPCSEPPTAGAIVSSKRVEATAKGVTAGVGIPVSAAAPGREASIECFAVRRGRTGMTVRASGPTLGFTRVTYD